MSILSTVTFIGGCSDNNKLNGSGTAANTNSGNQDKVCAQVLAIMYRNIDGQNSNECVIAGNSCVINDYVTDGYAAEYEFSKCQDHCSAKFCDSIR